MTVRVKICGITNWADAKLAIDAGAGALGFNFFPPSPRAVTPAAAWEIIRKVPPFVETVGIFVNWTAAAVIALSRALRLGAVQLHGDEPPAVVTECAASLKVIKAFRIASKFDVRRLAQYSNTSAYLLDGFDPALYGGTGKRVELAIAQRAKVFGPIILAGGLTPENVRDAILQARPYAVDVCSGVESKAGRKDAKRLRMLMRAVQEANLSLVNDSDVQTGVAQKDGDRSAEAIAPPAPVTVVQFLERRAR